jgi:type I restriction enzyme S subunit
MQRAGFDGQNCLYASYLIRARLQLDIINPRFLQTFLSSLEGRKRLREQARTSAGQYNINTEGLSSVRILLPPVQLQAKFEDLCRPLFGLYELQLSGKIKAEETFSALLARVFSGTSANSGFVKAV